jgi:hypothetical protein
MRCKLASYSVDHAARIAVAALTGIEGYELITTLEQLVEQGLLTDGADGLACRSSILSSRVSAAITPTSVAYFITGRLPFSKGQPTTLYHSL